MKVTVRNGNVKKALSVFKRKHSDKMLEVRQRQYYVKPTTKRSQQRRVAEIRERKRQLENKIVQA